MSHIFSTETKTTTRPRHDATIRIQYMGPDETKWAGQWRTVQLYEFHPDYDNRSKFRSYAYTSIPDDIIQGGRYHTGVYHIMGQGYLEHPYLNVRETVMHEADLRELMDYCRSQHHPASPLVIHPCPLSFPMFSKGDRVVCIKTDDHMATDAHVGQHATVAEDSSAGGGTIVTFDIPELNKGTDGRIYQSIGFASISLRKLEQGEHLQVVVSKRKYQRKGEQAEKQYKVALWPSTTSSLGDVTEIDTVAENATQAALSAMKTNGANYMGMIVVMSGEQQEWFRDATRHTGNNTLAYSRTGTSPRFTDKPFIWKESEQ